jgi:hypothetical protein
MHLLVFSHVLGGLVTIAKGYDDGVCLHVAVQQGRRRKPKLIPSRKKRETEAMQVQVRHRRERRLVETEPKL